MSKNLLSDLRQGLAAMGLDIDKTTAEQLVSFLHLLHKWNKVYNLTAIRSLEQMLTHHLLDSLAVAPYIIGEEILDVGTGAGFPGIPLAFIYPKKHFVLLDSNGKKIRFIDHVQSTFALGHVKAHQERVEKFRSELRFDVIICRALGDMQSIMRDSQHLIKPTGRWLFMKGTYPQEELNAIQGEAEVHELRIPGVDAQRHLVIVPASNMLAS